MFFLLSKTLDAFLQPLTWALLLIAIAMLAARARTVEAVAPGKRTFWPKPGTRLRRGVDRVARAALPVAFGALLVFSLEPTSNALVRMLEVDAPRTQKPGVTYDAVILLGGLVEDRVDSHGTVAYNDNVERLHGTYEVLRSGQARFAIVSGGSWANTVPEATTLAAELIRLGIEPERVLIEDKSRNTRENALFSAEIIRDRKLEKLLVVTSAFHMQRAVRCFEVVGLAVDALPVDYKSYDPAHFSGSFIPRSKSLFESSYAIRELAGRVVYRLSGR